MQEPLTELDERFSDPGATATPWAKAREVLETAQLSWVTTVRADGRPHVTPLVAVWLDDAVHFTTLPSRRHGNRSAGHPPFRLKQLGRRGWANQRVVLKLEGSSPLYCPTPHPDAVPRSCPAPPSRVRAAGGKSLRLRTQHAGDDAIVC